MKKMDINNFLVKENQRIHLADWPTEPDHKIQIEKKDSEKALEKLSESLDELQNLLFASHSRKVLIILQGIDSAGKDSVIRHVFKVLDPQGLRVVGFKIPTEQELDRDYLWRAHKEVPAKGEMVIFNRSYYEDVLVVRVHKLAEKNEWKKRFRQINDFERMLVEEGTVVLKFFLHISKEEQKRRFEDRLKDPSKNWKFKKEDLKERIYWNQYSDAFEDMLENCSKDYAPWFIVPSDKKWFRDHLISQVIVDRMEKLSLKYPKIDKKSKQAKIK
jgi:PPK2 family polyphosphate:nucleotide phosphotransferase